MGNPGASFFETLVGQRIAGRYLVDRLLGFGGMGIVASAKYPELGQKVAIKFLRPEFAEDGIVTARFLREARVAARVKSAHFVRVFDVGKLENGVPYLVMELLTGRDLSEELSARGPLPVEAAVDFVLQAAQALAELHALGIVHRDLKPSNLFLETSAGTSTLKVLDFGISKEQKRTDTAAAPLTSTDHVLGTPQYMSPEQIRASKNVDERSDVWALGIILYELLTQALPFTSDGGGVGEMFGKILYVDPETPRSKRADLPEELEAIIMNCMAREREARYASVVELATALGPFAGPASAHRIELVRQAARTPRIDEDEPADALPETGSARVETQHSTPAAKRDNLVLAPTAPASERKLAATKAEKMASASEPEKGAAVTAMTASSVVTTRKAVGRASNKTIYAAAAVALVAIGAAVRFGLKKDESAATSTSAAAAGATSTASVPFGSGIATETPSPDAAPNPEPAVSAEGPSAASAASAASARDAPSASAARATPRPRASTNASAARATPRPTASAPSLILDRK